MVSGLPWQLPTVPTSCLPSGFLQKLQGSAGTLYLILPSIIRADKKIHLRFLSTTNRTCVNSVSWQPEGRSVTWAALSRVQLTKGSAFPSLLCTATAITLSTFIFFLFFTGVGCPEKLWVLHPWRRSGLGWTVQPELVEGQPCPWQGGLGLSGL